MSYSIILKDTLVKYYLGPCTYETITLTTKLHSKILFGFLIFDQILAKLPMVALKLLYESNKTNFDSPILTSLGFRIISLCYLTLMKVYSRNSIYIYH